MVGKLATNDKAKIALGKQPYVEIFDKGLKIFPWDPPLSNNVCFALANLSLLCKPNQEKIMKQGILKKIPGINKQFIDYPECMKHMTSVINNLCYKNNSNKKVLGKKGFVKYCVNVHKRWAADGFNSDTCQ